MTLYFPDIDAPDSSAAPTRSDASETSEASDARTAPAAPHAGLRVLLVEDDPDVRGVAQAFLLSLGCTVVACHDANAALQALARSERFELLFSDIRLGAGIDGHELAQRAAALQPGIAVLLSSGYSRYLDGGGDGAPPRWPILKKPYDREALAQAIAACLSH